MKMTLLGQYFGDGNTTSYTIPGTVPSGYVLAIQVAGEFVDYTYSDASTVTITAPATNDIVSFFAVKSVVVASQVITAALSSKDGDLVFSAMNNGAGVTAAYTKATNGTQTMAAADADNNRNVLLIVDVTEAFATNTGTQPTFKIGETSTTAKFADTTAFASASLGARKVYAGTLSSTKALLVTAVAAVGDATGAITVTAIILPVAA
jgi:hypothetical protein